MKTVMKMMVGCLAACCAFDAVAAEVSQVVVRQRWPWSRLVDIDYVLACDPSEKMDVSVAAYNGSETLSLPLASFSGDLYGVSEGTHRIVWDPMATVYTNSGALTSFRVSLTSVPVPVYMIVDLTQAAGAEGQIAYVYESDLTNGLWGAWVRNPVTNNGTVVESVVWTGVTTNDIYKTDKLVLRRIHARTFGMGDSADISTTLTKDFYAGVFEVTQRQWELIKGAGTKPSNFYTDYATRPVENVSYNDIRGATDSSPVVDWPGTGVSVLPSSFVGLLRAKTGLTGFDLPTEAQWECLCRAGTTTYYNDGVAGTPNTTSNVQVDVLGRYRYNGGLIDGVTSPGRDVSPTNGTAVVGSYQANAWGLYDTHGNVWEWCLDWADSGSLTGGSDPLGAAAGSSRVLRGGCWGHPAYGCRSAYRDGTTGPSTSDASVGFRLVRAFLP